MKRVESELWKYLTSHSKIRNVIKSHWSILFTLKFDPNFKLKIKKVVPSINMFPHFNMASLRNMPVFAYKKDSCYPKLL